MLYGYARVSSVDQDLTIQRQKLTAAGCDVVRAEKITGTTTEGRAELDILLAFLREGDTLVVTRIDRLARSIRDLQNIVHDLKSRGIVLRATEPPIDTSTAAGKCFLDMLGSLRSSRPTCARSGSSRGSPRPRRKASTKGAGRPLW